MPIQWPKCTTCGSDNFPGHEQWQEKHDEYVPRIWAAERRRHRDAITRALIAQQWAVAIIANETWGQALTTGCTDCGEYLAQWSMLRLKELPTPVEMAAMILGEL